MKTKVVRAILICAAVALSHLCCPNIYSENRDGDIILIPDVQNGNDCKMRTPANGTYLIATYHSGIISCPNWIYPGEELSVKIFDPTGQKMLEFSCYGEDLINGINIGQIASFTLLITTTVNAYSGYF